MDDQEVISTPAQGVPGCEAAPAESGFVYVGLQDRASLPSYLGAIAECVGSGQITLESGGREFRAVPADVIRVRIEADRREDIVQMTVRLSWSEDSLCPGAGPELLITSSAP